MLLPPRVRLQFPPGGQAVQLYSLRVASADACFAFASPIFGALWMPLERARRHECGVPKKCVLVFRFFVFSLNPKFFDCTIGTLQLFDSWFAESKLN